MTHFGFDFTGPIDERMERIRQQIVGRALGINEHQYPPFNVCNTDTENLYVIEVAVAGFSKEDIDISVENSTLTVSCSKKEIDRKKFIVQGLSYKPWKRQFELTEHVEVKGADIKDGLLCIYLQHNKPEVSKPRKIQISTSNKQYLTG